jgi:cell division septation protein DedD
MKRLKLVQLSTLACMRTKHTAPRASFGLTGMLLATLLACFTKDVQSASATPAPTTREASSAVLKTAVGGLPELLARATAHYEKGELDDAFRLIVAPADSGAPSAVHLLARVHLQPRFRNFDPHEAARLMRQAANHGYAPAQHDLAELMRRGLGTKRDPLSAFRWHLHGAEQDFQPSELAIASMYENGEGVAKNVAQAQVWRERAKRRVEATSKPAAKTNSKRLAAGVSNTVKLQQTRKPQRSLSTRASAKKSALSKQTAAPAATAAAPQMGGVKSPSGQAKPSTRPSALGYLVQLGAFRNSDRARAQQAKIQVALQPLNTNLRIEIHRYIKPDGGGELHRLRAGPVRDLASASFICRAIKKRLQGQGCFAAPLRR